MVLNQNYYLGRSNSWKWNGVSRHWNIFVSLIGYNGAGGGWFRETWRWNKSSQVLGEQIKTLSWEDTQKIFHAVKLISE